MSSPDSKAKESLSRNSEKIWLGVFFATHFAALPNPSLHVMAIFVTFSVSCATTPYSFFSITLRMSSSLLEVAVERAPR